MVTATRRTFITIFLLGTSVFALPLRFERHGDSFVARDTVVDFRGARFGTVRMRFRGAKRCGVETGPAARLNYITGRDPRNWNVGVASVAEVRFTEIYPGIAVVYHAHAHDLEFDINVSPGADWRRIAIDFPGSRNIHIDSRGDAIVDNVRIRHPDVSQAGQHLEGHFVLADRNRLRFAVAGVDSRAPLLIDPVVVYATLAGGDDADQATGIALDSAGNAYVAGFTASSNFPTRAAFQGARAGVSKSTNGATQWITSGAGLSSVQVQSLAIDPAGVLYAATFAGVYKSTNAGQSWSATSALPSYYVNTLAIDPKTSTIYAGTLSATGGGIYKSGDGGATWTLLHFAGSDILSILVHPTISGVLLAGVGSSLAAGPALYRSTDGGATWTAIQINGPVNAIVADSQASPSLYVGTSGFTPAIYKSTDAGATWQTVLRNRGAQTMAVDPKTPSTIFAAGDVLLRSTDSGATWQANITCCSFIARSLAIDPVNTSNVYAGWTSGVSKSTDGGNTWAPANNGLNSVNVYSLLVDPRNPSTVYAGQRVLQKAFVAKYDPNGNLVYATYLGGANTEGATGVSVDSAGNAYVTGYTNSSDFPTTPGVFQSANAGTNDAFVAKLSSTGTLVYSTYLGGSASDVANGIAVDSAGNATIIGTTASTNFPSSLALQNVSKLGAGDSSVFVTRLNAGGSALLYSTIMSGAGNDAGIAIAVDAPGNAYVTGTPSTSFPLLNAFQTSHAATFVAKLNGSGAPVYASYLGGTSSNGSPYAIAVDASGSAYVTGYDASISTTNNFPLVNPLFSSGRGYLSKVAADGSALVYSTRLGSITASGQGVAVDPTGNAYVTGIVSSTDLPLMDPMQLSLRGPSNAFLMKFNPTGSALLYSTYFGGNSVTQASAIAVDAQGVAYIAGYVWPGTSYPLSVAAAQSAYGGGASDALIAKITSATSLPPSLAPAINLNGIITAAAGAYAFTPSPGSLASIFGADLASGIAGASSIPLPSSMNGTTVQINGVAAPILYVSPAQINVQIPWETSTQAMLSATVINGGGTSPIESNVIAAINPAFFLVTSAQGARNPAALIANTGGVLAAPVGFTATSRPVKPGEYVELYVSGLGPVTNTPADGAVAVASPLSMTLTTPTVMLGPPMSSVQAPVSFAGLAPGLVGVYQVNIQIPANAPTGNMIGLNMSMGPQLVSDTVFIPIQP